MSDDPSDVKLPPIRHEEVFNFLNRLREVNKPLTPDDLRFLAEYATQCQLTSADLRTTIGTVIELFGPDALMAVKQRVEMSRRVPRAVKRN